MIWMWFECEFARSIVNSKWIREGDRKLKVNSWKKIVNSWEKIWIRIEFVKKMVNSGWIREQDSELKIISRKR